MAAPIPARTHEEEEEEEEQFFESLDRILSSSCSSTSASDNDDPTAENHHHRNPSHRRRRSSAVPRSLPPPPSAAYEVWISEPSSVEERRRRLLQNMGLASDLPPPPPPPPAVRTNPVSESYSPPATPVRSVSLEEHRIPSSPSTTLRSKSEGYDKPSPNQEPVSSRALEEFKEQCRIRNLDTGSEFVVKEVREDGTWEKVKEINTGRHYTFQEFEMRFSSSPIVQELMRRQQGTANPELSTTIEPVVVSSPRNSNYNSTSEDTKSPARSNKKKGWLNGFKSMAGMSHHKNVKNGNTKEASEKGASRLSSVTDDAPDVGARTSGVGPERIRIRQYGKSYKQFTGVFMTQEIEAHTGAVWSIRFSADGKYMASAGEDKVIHVWEVVELEKKNVAGSNLELAGIGNGSPDTGLSLSCVEMSPRAGDRKKRGKVQSSRKSVSSHHLAMPDRVFQLGEKPICSLHGHGDDVLDLSWSKSQHLLSSSMDKTVKLWDISTRSCLKTFSHSDYVTCIQFNPVDNRYFISGSLDEKVRVWSIPDRKIVDWYDLHEMITAVCYTPDGQGALVGSHNGGCHLFDTSENKLHYTSQVDLHGRRKKSNHKKITGFQFVPGSTSEVLITSADSRIRVVNGTELVHKLKGFRNTSSQISASISSNGKYVICASEDSHVYIWRYDENPQPAKAKPSPVNITHSYENFHCHHVTVAATWPGSISDKADSIAETDEHHQTERSSNATWPEEKLAPFGCSPVCLNPIEASNGALELQRQSAWGLVIVTAARGGQIRVFQNFGFPVNV